MIDINRRTPFSEADVCQQKKLWIFKKKIFYLRPFSRSSRNKYYLTLLGHYDDIQPILSPSLCDIVSYFILRCFSFCNQIIICVVSKFALILPLQQFISSISDIFLYMLHVTPLSPSKITSKYRNKKIQNW